MPFVDILEELPPPDTFLKLVVEMHDPGTSQDGKLGLPYTVYGGQNPLVFPHCDSLEESFSGCLAHTFDMEERTHGPDEEMRQLRQQRFGKVIPRLLRPLKTQGRSLQPVLFHGDLWDENVAIDKTTGRPVIFDACPCYAHNECMCYYCKDVCHCRARG